MAGMTDCQQMRHLFITSHVSFLIHNSQLGLRSMEYGEWNSMEYMEWNGMERTCDFPWNSMESVILNSIKIWTFSSIIYWNRMLKFQYPDVIYP